MVKEMKLPIILLKSNFCDYNDAYIIVKGDITIRAAPQTQVTFKNYAPLTKCITNIDETTINDAENLDLVMPIYNLIEYSSNYSQTTGILCFILSMKELILMQILKALMILNLLSIRLNYQETQMLILLQLMLMEF